MWRSVLLGNKAKTNYVSKKILKKLVELKKSCIFEITND